MLFDTHAHYYDEAFDADRDQVLSGLNSKGVELVLCPGCDLPSSQASVDLADHYPFVYAAVGLHPENLEGLEKRSALEQLRALACRPKVKAIGEIGLDFYWDDRFVAEQTEAFIAQLHLAARLDLPAVIHTRAAWDRMTEIIETEARRIHDAGGRLRGVFHAFAEELETYERLRRCGEFLFGIGGVVTFKKSKLADTVREMRLDDLVLETDCPYLTPVPHRGERNESAYVRFVCEKVAQVKGITPDQVATATTANARRLFFDKCADRREP